MSQTDNRSGVETKAVLLKLTYGKQPLSLKQKPIVSRPQALLNSLSFLIQPIQYFETHRALDWRDFLFRFLSNEKMKKENSENIS